jgi:membrane fusion protein (multidrug efflux system)
MICRHRRSPLLLQIALRVASCAAVLFVAGCDKPAAPPPPPPPEVSVIKVEARDTPVTAEYVALTQSPQQVSIVARVNGFLDKQLYTEGTVVKPGQVLFQMDTKPFVVQLDSAKASRSSAKAAHDTALANLKRVKPLVELNALSQKDLDDAIGQEQTTNSSLEQAGASVENAQLNLSYTTIASPLNGVAAAAQQKVGAYLSTQNNMLTTVSSLNPMWVNFSISENELTGLRNEMRVGRLRGPSRDKYTAEIVLVDGSTFSHSGTISFVDPSYNSQTGTFLIRVTLPNPQGELRPNQYVKVRLKGAIRPNAILVPQRSVQQGSKGHFVWVIDPDGKVENRPVAVGDWYGDQWFINDGLKAGDQVVVDGALRLKAGGTARITAAAPAASAASAAPAASAASAAKS